MRRFLPVLLALLSPLAHGQSVTGSVDGFNSGAADPGSGTCTVPMDADLVVAFFSHWDGGGGSGMSSITLNSAPFTILDQQIEDASHIGGGVAILENPSTGSQTCAWAWTAGGIRSDGGAMYFVYLTGANIGNTYEDADTFAGAFGTGSENVEVTLTTVSGELILAHAMAYSPGTPDITGDTVVDGTNDELLGVHYSDLGSITAAGSSTLIEMTGETYSVMSAIALKPLAAGMPTFDSGPTVTIIDSDTYRLTYDADAVADTIFVMLKAKDASAPTCADVEAGTGGRGTATEATTGASDTIDITNTDSPAGAVFDIYWCLEEGVSNYSTLGSQLDALLAAFSGMQRITITGVSSTGLLNGSGAVAGDVLELSLLTSPVPGYDILPESDGDYEIDSGGDESKQTFSAWFYDFSVPAWSSMSAQLICVNNSIPRVGIGSYPLESSLIEDVLISPISLLNDAVDDDGDDLTVTLQSGTLPPNLSLAANEITGTPTTPNVSYTIQRYMDECASYVDLKRAWIIKPDRPLFIGVVTDLEFPVDMAIAPIDFSTEFGHSDLTPPAVSFTLQKIGNSSLETLANEFSSLGTALSVDDASGIAVGDYISTESGPNPVLVLAKYTNNLELESALPWADNDDIFLWTVAEDAPSGLALAANGTLTGTPLAVATTSGWRVRATDTNTRIKDSSEFNIAVLGLGGIGKSGIGSLSIGNLGL